MFGPRGTMNSRQVTQRASFRNTALNAVSPDVDQARGLRGSGYSTLSRFFRKTEKLGRTLLINWSCRSFTSGPEMTIANVSSDSRRHSNAQSGGTILSVERIARSLSGAILLFSFRTGG